MMVSLRARIRPRNYPAKAFASPLRLRVGRCPREPVGLRSASRASSTLNGGACRSPCVSQDKRRRGIGRHLGPDRAHHERS
jgi:hypothetical protein